MAGHRQAAVRPRRTDARRERMLARLAAAATAGEQLAIAFDWFRMEARRSDEQARLMRDAAQFLAAKAAEINGRANGYCQ